MKFSLAAIALLSTFTAVLASPAPPFDPSGAKNVGNGQGKQFIGGQCLSQADCESGCCAKPTGICSGVGAQLQAGKQGCGFGGDTSPAGAAPVAASPAAVANDAVQVGTGSSDAAASVSSTPASSANPQGGPAFDQSGAKNVGNGKGGQFIGGQCLSQADCGSGCCAKPAGICSGPGAQFQAGKQGCGFQSQQKRMVF